MNALELSHVTKHFPGFTLQDLSLTVPSGTICGLVGENGAGKSTTIRLLMGALRPDSGTCTVLGADSAAPEFLSLKEDIGVVLDEAYFPESLNALQVGGVMAKTYRRWDGKQYQNYLTRFGLPEKKPFKDFSRGMKMKLAIAVALSHSPRLLVLDEATAGLDPIVRDEVLEIFNEFTREEDHSILISSHILSDLEKLCDYIAFLHQGRLAMFLIIFLVCASAGGIATIEQSSLDGGFYLSLSLVPAAIAAVVLTVVSIPLAIRFYGRRSR